jgi:hypothetical protein
LLELDEFFFAMATDADTTSADTLGRPNCASGNCHSCAEGNKLTSGLAATLACTFCSGPKSIHNADEIMA